MRKTRLSKWSRMTLRTFARENLQAPKEQKAYDAAYAKATPLVLASVRKKFPEDDMAVLRKYEMTTRDRCFRGGTPGGAFITFEFSSDEEAPEVPDQGCQTYPLNQKATDAVIAWEKAKNALDTAKRAKLTSYNALIYAAVYYEDVVAVWPAAEALRPKIVKEPCTALVALSNEVREFIRQDNAGAQLVA